MSLHLSNYRCVLCKLAYPVKLLVFFILLLIGAVSLGAQGGPVRNMRTGRTYINIQNAIYEAATGDTIRVRPGTYNESLRINNTLTLEGVSEGGQTPRLAPAADQPAVSIVNPPRGSQVTIDGFDMRVSTSWYAVLGEVATTTLRNCVIRGDGRGIAIKTFIPGGLVLESNVVSEFPYGVLVENEDQYPVRNIQIHNNTFENTIDAIYLTSAPAAVISGNVIRNSPDPGRYGTSSAITLNGSPESQIIGNTVCTAHYGIFVVSGSGTLVQYNSIHDDMDTAGSGVYIVGGSDVVVTQNKVEGVEYAMIFGDTRNASVYQNWLEDSEYGLQNSNRYDPAYQVDARQNWWDSNDGPSLEGSGRGVPVNENVLFEPWLTSPPAFQDRSCR